MERFAIAGAQGQTIRGYVHAPPGQGRCPVLLLAHGFKGFADYGFLPLMAQRLAEAGFVVVRFSFSHCGIEDNPDSFTRPDLFEHDNFSLATIDLLALIAAIRAEAPGLGRADGRLPAGHHRAQPRRHGGHPGHRVHRRAETHRHPIQPEPNAARRDDPPAAPAIGRVRSPSTRTGQDLYIGRVLVDDIDAAGERYDLLRLWAIPGAYMAVHCRGDATVPAHMAEELAAAHSAGATELVLLDGGSHTFDFRHAQEGSTPVLDAAIERIVSFLHKHLPADDA